MNEEDILNAEPQGLTPFAELVGIGDNPVLGFFLLYAIVTVLSVIVFNLGFARKLPVLKAVIVYLLLVIGCFVLTFFAIGLPIAEGLLIAALILGIYKFRLYQSKKGKKNN